MSANSSFNSSVYIVFDDCVFSEIKPIVLGLLIVNVVVMPLFFSILVVGYQKKQKQTFWAFLTTSSHIDIFTYNVVILDLLGVSGMCLYYFGSISDQKDVKKVGLCTFGIFGPGQTLFHLVTCVERYLAVVHPVIYLRLRGQSGIKVRNITIGCVWLISFSFLVLATWFHVDFALISFLLLCITSVAFSFCSVSVLCVLIRPGPGEGGGCREHADTLKQRTFHTIMIITGVLSLRFLSNLIIFLIQNLSEPSSYLYCVTGWSSVWFYVPSSLVLPLLFLQKEGKLPGCGLKSEETT